jgi:hypothetical protein
VVKPNKNRLIFGALLIILVVVAFIILGHFKIPSWPAFLVMICFFETHMDKQKIPDILVGGAIFIAAILGIIEIVTIMAIKRATKAAAGVQAAPAA